MALIGPARLVAQSLGCLEQFYAVAQSLRRTGLIVERYAGVEAEPPLGAECGGQGAGGGNDTHAICSWLMIRRSCGSGARAGLAAAGIDSSNDTV